MVERPTGTVTFLFTDIEGSTRLWEEHPVEMQAALERHDAILRSAIEGHGGYVFTTAGDSFAAAFTRARDAVDATVAAQRGLAAELWPEATTIRVRMGLHTGEAQERGGDYFGPVLNRAAWVMAAGHGGQILVGASTASVVDDVDVDDLGEHRLKDLSGVEHLFQITAHGLDAEFPPLRTVDETPGNLPSQATSFVGRDAEVKELSELVRAHRLVTLTGVGGVGKTRLAVQVAAELTGEFPDGVWLVELAPVGDSAAVPDSVATELGVTPQAGMSVTASVAEALAGRRLLIVLDNCEHVLDAAAEVVMAVLARSDAVCLLATSREGLRVDAEHLWPVPSLGVGAGVDSAAVALFVERAVAVNPGFVLNDASETAAVTELCERLDGIALAIELAAARMVSMSPAEVRDRLGDRFRLLSGGRRGLERHQTLRHAVAWSYDLLEDDERAVLNHCAVFADGFDLAAVAHIYDDDGSDEYVVLDLLDSLVRKSLVTAEQVSSHTRYRLLETIRQYAEDQLVETGVIGKVRDRHAQYFADEAVQQHRIWESPDQLSALDWVDAEFANLRAGFRWAADNGDLVAAAAIASHTTPLAWQPQLYEPIGWAEEILEAVIAADLPHLPRLYNAAAMCLITGRPEVGLGYAQRAIELEKDPRYEPFAHGWQGFSEAAAQMYSGKVDRSVETISELAALTGFSALVGRVLMLQVFPGVGRAKDAAAIADETLAEARAHGNPVWIGVALGGYGRTFTEIDPARALDALQEGLAYAREHRLGMFEDFMTRDAAALEASHGELDVALEMFDTTIDSLHRAGHVANLLRAFAYLTVLFDRLDLPEIAAIVYGPSTKQATNEMVIGLPEVLDRLRSLLGADTFEECVASGIEMELSDAVQYARTQIHAARRHLHESA